MTRVWSRDAGQTKPQKKEVRVQFPPGNFATEGDLGVGLLQSPDGDLTLGVMMGHGLGAPIEARFALYGGVLFGRGWKPIRVSEAEIQASEVKDPLSA